MVLRSLRIKNTNNPLDIDLFISTSFVNNQKIKVSITNNNNYNETKLYFIGYSVIVIDGEKLRTSFGGDFYHNSIQFATTFTHDNPAG